MNNEDRFTQCKQAILEQSKENFSTYSLSLLHHGYLLHCGKRGGLSKKWVGHVRDEEEYYAHLRDVYERSVSKQAVKG